MSKELTLEESLDLVERYEETETEMTVYEVGAVYHNAGLPPQFDDAISPGHGLWWVSGDKFAEYANQLL